MPRFIVRVGPTAEVRRDFFLSVKIPFATSFFHQILQVIENGITFPGILSTLRVNLTSDIRLRLQYDLLTYVGEVTADTGRH